MPRQFSIVIPAKNEEQGLRILLPRLKALYPNAELIVVDDASTDETAKVATSLGAKLISHAYSKGNGAAVKTGLRAVTEDIVVCMDGDGQHRAEDLVHLLEKLGSGFDMVVGARNRSGHAAFHRSLANRFYNRLASWMVGCKVEDLTSGFRAIYKEKFCEFISLLPNKFSYPTTITMSFFRAGYSVAYVEVDVKKRVKGTNSHISIWRDGVRFLLIIFKVGTLFSPLKIFVPISFFFFCSGLAYYLYTYFSDGRFTNMGVLLFMTSILIFFMGLISEQITSLIYKEPSRK